MWKAVFDLHPICIHFCGNRSIVCKVILLLTDYKTMLLSQIIGKLSFQGKEQKELLYCLHFIYESDVDVLQHSHRL